MDETLLHRIFKHYEAIITIEDGTIIGGFGSSVLAFANAHSYKHKILVKGIADEFIEHGTIHQLMQLQHLDAHAVKKDIQNLILTLNNG